jgi:hypothetical protein
MRAGAPADLSEHRKLQRSARRVQHNPAWNGAFRHAPEAASRTGCACGGACPACQARYGSPGANFRGGLTDPVPVGAPPPRSAGLGSATPTVTLSGLDFSATATYSPCSDCTDGLEAIQVAWARDGVRSLGANKAVFPPLAAPYDTFVDGGRYSPAGALYKGDHPYYIGRDDLPASYGYTASMFGGGTVSGCMANATDMPTAANLWSEIFFETVFVCLNYQGGGKDKLLDSVKWGFTDFGKGYSAEPRLPNVDVIVSSEPSTEFKNTLSADYPSYSYV